MIYRTHTCNDLRIKDIWAEIILSGWVHRRRDHWDIIFIDLRDRYGLTQIAFDPAEHPEAHKNAHSIRSEFVIKVSWTVRSRPKWQENSRMETWDIEVLISRVEILSVAKTTPFEIDYERQVSEEIRLKYRYLDLRRDRMRDNIIFRSRLTKFIRDFYEKSWFLEIETPIMIKWTPEGSREYIVPSRIYPWNFFVLPQSPQQLKQLLMVAWFDKYYQIAKCFRDEDQRGDRQPEFTQVDVEMSFINQEEIIDLHEKLIIQIMEKFAPEKKLLFKPFKHICYAEAMDKYGSDKPDLRYNLEIKDISDLVVNCSFKVFSSQAGTKWNCVRALCVPWWDKFTRKEIDDLTVHAQNYWAKGLAYLQIRDEWLTWPVAKFLSPEELQAIQERVWAKKWDIIFFGADRFTVVCSALWAIRIKSAEMMWLINDEVFAFVWVTDFPLFEMNDQGQIWSTHHPFTMPYIDDLALYENSDLTKIRSHAYDITLNWVELGWGSIRIYDQRLQKKMFELLGINAESQEKRFGHMLQAFEYWAPPHWWLALWLDRVIMLLRWEKNIREIMPFPKDQKSKDLMLWAPSEVDPKTMEELCIQIKEHN